MEDTGGDCMVIDSADSLKWCSVSVNEVINKGYRLEASVYDVDAKKAWEKVINCHYGSIPLVGDDGIVDNAFYPGRFKRIYTEHGGEPFFLPSQLGNVYPKADKRISRLTKCDIEELRLKENTLLLTRSGTIGNVGYVSETLKGKVFSDDVIRVSFNNDYDLGYCYTFLKSEIGSKVLQTNGYGSVITHLEPEHLQEMRIPDAPIEIRKRINDKISESYKLRDESNVLIDQAESELISELELPDEEELQRLDNREFFSVSLSDLNYRLDGSYHLPIFDKLYECMSKKSETIRLLSDSSLTSNIVLPPRFKRTYVEAGHGRVLFGGKQIHELDPSNKKYLSLTAHDKMYREQLIIKENTILVTRSGTIGKVALTPRHWENWVASDHIIRIIPSSNDIAGYLYIFLQSRYGYYFITKHTYGSVIDEVDDTQLGEIPIPILKDCGKQKHINELALEANRKRYEAYLCEQSALEILNNEVFV